MAIEALLVVLSRWIHVTSACIALGGVFFLWLVLPRGLAALDETQRTSVLLRTRSVFKKVIHTAILLFILTGTYNTIVNWPAYKLAVPMSHALLGVHLLLGAFIFVISIIMLRGAEPPSKHRTLLAVNLVLLLLTVAAASALKYAREHPSPRSDAAASR